MANSVAARMAEHADQDACKAALEALRVEMELRDMENPGARHIIAAKFCEGLPSALDHLEHVIAMQRQGIPLAIVFFETRPVRTMRGHTLFVAIAAVPRPVTAPAANDAA